MNEKLALNGAELLAYQAERLQELIRETVQCCEDRKLYESQRFSLPYAELKCLMLFDGQRYLTLKEMAKHLDVAKSRVTKLVSGLLDKGLVVQADDPRDRRIKLITLTPTGREKADEIRDFQRLIHRKLLLQMDVQERRSVLLCLEVLRSAMESVKAELV